MSTRILVILAIVSAFADVGVAQLNQNCVATVANRSVQVSANGTFAVPNIPADIGLYRVRVICQNGGVTTQGQSAYFSFVANGNSRVPPIKFGAVTPPPISIAVSAPSMSLAAAGQTVQLKVTGTLTNGSSADLTTQAQGTLYLSSNAKIASVSADGLVTAVGRGTVIVTARNEGAAATISLSVNIPVSTVGDGIPDTWKLQHGFSVTDPGVANADPDNDGLTNLKEYQLGTNPLSADTDGDGVPDGQEVQLGTNPLNPDTDGDGLPDGQELLLKTNALNPDTDGDGILDGIEVSLGLNPLVADPTTTVQGRVLNSKLPVSGASVMLFGLITGVTDGTGFFSIPFVPADLGPLTAIARVTINNVVLEGESNPVAPGGSATNVGVIQLGQSNGSISGVVTDIHNTPVANAQVTINIGAESRVTLTDFNGLYAFSGFTPNSFVVSATDLTTGLNGQSTGFLFANSSAVANIQLTAAGAIKGTVFATDGVTPVANANVVLSGTSLATTGTNEAGQFSFNFVPVGKFTLDATDGNGNQGRSTGSISKTGSIVQANVTFLGRGTVSGKVTDGSQNPVSDADVSLNSKGIFGGVSTTSTDATGNYTFSNIFIGPFNVTARSSALQLGGQSSGSIGNDQQNVTANIVLGAAGTVTGTIFQADGVTPDPNAQVTLSNGATTQADTNGLYTLNLVPLGAYTIAVTDPSDGDQGAGSVTIATQGQTQTVNINLNGQGNVAVTVIDALGNPDASAIVNLTGQTAFGGSFNGITQVDGTLTFSQVPAGAFAVTASDPVTQAGGGPISGTVAPGATAPVMLQLQPVGSVAGFVFAANGVTPVSGITVNLIGALTQATATASDGSFLFSVVPSGTYTLQAVDGAGSVRATAAVTVASQGRSVNQNLVLVGFGTVSGVVSTAEGPAAVNASVTLTDAAGNVQVVATDASGGYLVSQVAVGSFTEEVVYQGSTQLESGFAQGQITSDGFSIREDIRLVGESQLLPASLWDANGRPYNIANDGSLQPGYSREFVSAFSTDPQGALLLDVISGNTAAHFTGSTSATTASSGRELDIQQQGLAGLNITRKIFVPVDGYFARYIEVLQNPTANAITVGLRFTTNLRYSSAFGSQGGTAVPPSIVTTSSGDNVLDVVSSINRDYWGVFQDTSTNVAGAFATETLPPIGHIFQGPGAVLQASSAEWNVSDPKRLGALQEEFDDIVVAPGAEIALLHFLSIQVNVNGAIAASQRLVQLPPEALAGLSSSDLAAIQNFSIPGNGVSTLPALEPLTGQIFGQVVTVDGVTGIPGSFVTFQSNDPLFANTVYAFADSTGNYTFAGQFAPFGGSTVVPVTGFVVQATDSVSGLKSDLVAGSFPTGSTTTRQNLTIAGGLLTGTVFDSNGQPVSGGTVSTAGHSPVAIASNGSYTFTELAGGVYTLTASILTSQGPPLIGRTTATVVQGQKTVANISVEAAGSVSGTVFSVNNTPFPDLSVQLQTDSGDYQTATDAGGNFVFSSVAAGAAALVAYDPVSQSGAGVTITVLPNQTTNQNLNLIQGTGTVTGIVTEFGFPVVGAQVTVSTGGGGGGPTTSVRPSGLGSFTPSVTVTTGSDGSYSVSGISVGPVTVLAVDTATGASGQSQGFVALPGTTTTINVTVQRNGSRNILPDRPRSAEDDSSSATLFDLMRMFPEASRPWRSEPAPGRSLPCTGSGAQESGACSGRGPGL